MNVHGISECLVEPLEYSRTCKGAAQGTRKRGRDDPEVADVNKLQVSKMNTTAELPRKRRHVHFPDQIITTTRLVQSRHQLTESDRSVLWVQRPEVASTLLDVSSTIEESFLAGSPMELTAYLECLAASYLMCCNPPKNKENVDDTTGDDEASLVQQIIQPQAQTLAYGGAFVFDRGGSNSSPLHMLRGLETQILPELANERYRRRVEHVSCLVQLHQLVRNCPDGDAVIGAISRQLSQPSRHFAAVLGTADALVVEQDSSIEAKIQQEAKELADFC